jgi:hypothetical protein
MELTLTEEGAARQFAVATLSLLKAFRAADNSRLVGEIRRIASEAHESELASLQNQQAARPLLFNARQAAKSLSISAGTLWNLTAPQGPIPSAPLGTYP